MRHGSFFAATAAAAAAASAAAAACNGSLAGGGETSKATVSGRGEPVAVEDGDVIARAESRALAWRRYRCWSRTAAGDNDPQESPYVAVYQNAEGTICVRNANARGKLPDQLWAVLAH
jgi:hypothetical protein